MGVVETMGLRSSSGLGYFVIPANAGISGPVGRSRVKPGMTAGGSSSRLGHFVIPANAGISGPVGRSRVKPGMTW